MTSATPARYAGPRYNGLDAVRAFALFLGLVLHTSMSFIEPQIWVVKDPSTSPVMAITFYAIHIFRMTLFFILAGFLGRLVLETKGVGGFIKNRLLRIAAPLAIFWPLVMTGIIAVMIAIGARMTAEAGGVAPPAPPMPGIEAFPLSHLWFLYVLLLFYPAALILRAVTKPFAAIADAIVQWSVKFGLTAVLFAIPLFTVLWLTPDWSYWFGVKTPDAGFVPNAAALTGYGTAFAFGWLVHRKPEVLTSLGKWSPALLIEGLIGVAFCLYLIGTTPVFDTGAGSAKPIYTAAYAITAWVLSLGLIGAGHRFLNAENKTVRYLSDASYWTYIVHIPLVMGFQVGLLDLALPAVVKCALIVALTLLISVASYALLVRYSFIGSILNGKRRKDKAPKVAETPA